MSGRNQVAFTKPEEPAFLKQFKQRAGYKQGPTVEDKRQGLKLDEKNLDDRPDEQPLIVTLKPGDLTEEEFETHKLTIESLPTEADDGGVSLEKVEKPKPEEESFDVGSGSRNRDDGMQKKLLFRKPGKRSVPASDGQKTVFGGKPTAGDSASKKQKSESTMEKVRNQNLLSFATETEED